MTTKREIGSAPADVSYADHESAGDGDEIGEVDDPTDVQDALALPGETSLEELAGEPTDRDAEPGALVPADAVLVKLPGAAGPFSVMEQDFLDAVDGSRTLEELAHVLALHLRGARRIAGALLARGTIEMR